MFRSPPLQTASASDGVGISCIFLKTSSRRRAPAGSIFFFSPPPFRRDVWIGVDLQTRPPDLLLEQSGLDFTRDLPPSSPHASETDGPPVGNGLRAVCQRINLHPSVLGRKGRREIKYWIFFFLGGAAYFWRKGANEATKTSQHHSFLISLPDFGRLIWKMKWGLAAFCVAETKAEGETCRDYAPNTSRHPRWSLRAGLGQMRLDSHSCRDRYGEVVRQIPAVPRKSPPSPGSRKKEFQMRTSACIQHQLQPLAFLSHIYNSKAIKQINLITAKLGSFGSIKARL